MYKASSVITVNPNKSGRIILIHRWTLRVDGYASPSLLPHSFYFLFNPPPPPLFPSLVYHTFFFSFSSSLQVSMMTKRPGMRGRLETRSPRINHCFSGVILHLTSSRVHPSIFRVWAMLTEENVNNELSFVILLGGICPYLFLFFFLSSFYFSVHNLRLSCHDPSIKIRIMFLFSRNLSWIQTVVYHGFLIQVNERETEER